MGMKNDVATVPFYAFESIQAEAERSQRRLLTVLTASMVLNIALVFRMARKGF